MSGVRSLSQILRYWIHCSGSSNGLDCQIEDIDYWHFKRGFKRSNAAIGARFRDAGELKHVGYPRIIHLDGRIMYGRSYYEVGAHTSRYNRDIACCLIGTDKFTEAQWISLRGLIQRDAIATGLEVKGHCESPYTQKSCPGFSVESWLSSPNNMAPLPGHIYEGAIRPYKEERVWQ